MSNQIALILLGIIILALTFVTLKTAQSVCRKTGVNTISRLHRFLWVIQFVLIVPAFALIGDDKIGLGILLLVGGMLLFSALHFLLSRKAGTKYAIIMGILQGITGGLWTLLVIFFWVAKIALSLTGAQLGGKTSLNLDAQMKAIQAQKENEYREAQLAAERDRNDRADAYAQGLGFRDADEAERNGIDTGKNYR